MPAKSPETRTIRTAPCSGRAERERTGGVVTVRHSTGWSKCSPASISRGRLRVRTPTSAFFTVAFRLPRSMVILSRTDSTRSLILARSRPEASSSTYVSRSRALLVRVLDVPGDRASCDPARWAWSRSGAMSSFLGFTATMTSAASPRSRRSLIWRKSSFGMLFPEVSDNCRRLRPRRHPEWRPR